MTGKKETQKVAVLMANAISVSATGGPNTLLPDEGRLKAARELGAFLNEHPTAWMDFLNQLADALVYAHGEIPKRYSPMDKRDMADTEALLGLYELMTGLVSLRRGNLFDSGGSLHYSARKAENAASLVHRAELAKSISAVFAERPKGA